MIRFSSQITRLSIFNWKKNISEAEVKDRRVVFPVISPYEKMWTFEALGENITTIDIWDVGKNFNFIEI